MQEGSASLLSIWQNFYVIVGTSASALIGLMFVVVTLIMGDQERRVRVVPEAIGAFSTPSVVHFGAALLVAAILCAPWPVLSPVGLLLGLCGLGGVVYVVVVVLRTRRQTIYQPVLEDWLWHTIFPLVSYMALAVAAILLLISPVPTLFVIGAATVLLLFIGIHNAWDAVTYLVIRRIEGEKKEQDQ